MGKIGPLESITTPSQDQAIGRNYRQDEMANNRVLRGSMKVPETTLTLELMGECREKQIPQLYRDASGKMNNTFSRASFL